MQRHESIGIFMDGVAGNGGDTDIVEGVDGVDLELQLLKSAVATL